MGQGSTPATVPLANSGAVADEGLGPSARVVDRGPICKQFSSEDGVGGDPRVPAGYSLGKKLVGKSFPPHHLALLGLPLRHPYKCHLLTKTTCSGTPRRALHMRNAFPDGVTPTPSVRITADKERFYR